MLEPDPAMCMRALSLLIAQIDRPEANKILINRRRAPWHGKQGWTGLKRHCCFRVGPLTDWLVCSARWGLLGGMLGGIPKAWQILGATDKQKLTPSHPGSCWVWNVLERFGGWGVWRC